MLHVYVKNEGGHVYCASPPDAKEETHGGQGKKYTFHHERVIAIFYYIFPRSGYAGFVIRVSDAPVEKPPTLPNIEGNFSVLLVTYGKVKINKLAKTVKYLFSISIPLESLPPVFWSFLELNLKRRIWLPGLVHFLPGVPSP